MPIGRGQEYEKIPDPGQDVRLTIIRIELIEQDHHSEK